MLKLREALSPQKSRNYCSPPDPVNHLDPQIQSDSTSSVEVTTSQEQDLEFVVLLRKQQLVFAQETQRQEAGDEGRRKTFLSLLQEVDSGLNEARTTRQREFDSLIKEQKAIHNGRRASMDARFSAAEESRGKSFSAERELYEQQFALSKREWEDHFAEGRKVRQMIFKQLEDQQRRIAESLLERYNHDFSEEQKARNDIVERFAQENHDNIHESTEAHQATPAVSDEAGNGVAAPMATQDDNSGWGAASPNQDEDSGWGPWPVSDGWGKGSPEAITRDAPNDLNTDPAEVESDHIDSQRGALPTKSTSMSTAVGSSLVSTDRNATPRPSYEERFQKTQAIYQRLFDQAQAERSSVLSHFDTLFEQCLSHHRSQFELTIDSFSRIGALAERSWQAEQSSREQVAQHAEEMRERIFEDLSLRMWADFRLANKKEDLWDSHQTTLITYTEKAIVCGKKTEQETLFDQAMAGWKQILQSVVNHDLDSEPFIDFVGHDGWGIGLPPPPPEMPGPQTVLPHTRPAWRYSNAEQDKRVRFGGPTRGTGRKDRLKPTPAMAPPEWFFEAQSQTSTSIQESATFSVKSLFVDTGPLLRGSLPVPADLQPEDVTVMLEDDTRTISTISPPGGNGTFTQAQKERSLAFEIGMKERQLAHQSMEIKRDQEFARAQRRRREEFRLLQREQDTRTRNLFRNLREHLARQVFTFEEEFQVAQSRWRKNYLDSENQRKQRWRNAREGIVTNSFFDEDQRLERLHNYMDSGKLLGSAESYMIMAATSRQRAFERLMAKAKAAPVRSQ